MNPKNIIDNRPIVWTVSQNNNTLYCLYINSNLVYEDLPFETFYPLYKKTVADITT